MLLRQLRLTLILSFFSVQTFSQTQKQKPLFDYLDAGIAANSNQLVSAIGVSHFYHLDSKHRFNVGWGIRFSNNTGNNTTFVTAPAKLTTGHSGPLVLFQDNIAANFDTIQLSRYSVGSINLSIHLNYAWNERWSAEFNIDALGITLGKSQQAGYQTSKSAMRGKSGDIKASPTMYNFLLTSDNDIGSLNSELFLRYRFKQHWAIRAGVTFIFAEYTTNQKLFLDNNRFRNKALLPLIGFSYAL